MVVCKGVIACGLQLAVGIVGLAKSTVIAAHVAEQAHIILIGIDHRLDVGLTIEVFGIDLGQLVVAAQCGAMLTHQVIGYGGIEDRSHLRDIAGLLEAVGHLDETGEVAGVANGVYDRVSAVVTTVVRCLLFVGTTHYRHQG